MKPFEDFALDRDRLRDDLTALETFLGPDASEKDERADILPFFKSRPHITSLVFLNNSGITEPTLLKYELELFGDHACDVAVGQAATGRYCFVEFEEAKAGSVFKKGGKGVSEWSARFEHGFSQVVDWFYTLDDMRHTERFRDQFGVGLADYTGALVIGRRGFLDDGQRKRLRWRRQHVQVAGKRVECMTFDDLLDAFRVRVDMLTPPPSRPAKKGK